MFDPRSREKSERKKKATQEEAAWRSRRAVEFGHQTVDVLSADNIILCWHTSFSLTIRYKLEICISKWYAGPHDSVLVFQYAVKFYKEFIHSYFITFIARDFFTTTNRIGYTKILSYDFQDERCTVLSHWGTSIILRFSWFSWVPLLKYRVGALDYAMAYILFCS